jgi:hypothetical protein
MRRHSCAFCPAPATTGEHIWSDWSNELLGPKRRYLITQSIANESRTWQSVGLHQKYPVLCAPDNNAWGGGIEAKMKAVSQYMVRDGAPTVLSATDVGTIAVYAQLKAFVCDYAQDRVPLFYESSDRAAFRDDLTIPVGTSVWLAHTIDDHGVFKGAYAQPPLETPKRFHTYVFTVSLGQLVIQLTNVRWTKKSNRKYERSPLLRQALQATPFSVPIWPKCTTPIYWPPRLQMDREALDRYFKRWERVEITQ